MRGGGVVMEVKNRHGTGGVTEGVFVCRIWQSCRLVAVGEDWGRFGGDLEEIWTGLTGWQNEQDFLDGVQADLLSACFGGGGIATGGQIGAGVFKPPMGRSFLPQRGREAEGAEMGFLNLFSQGSDVTAGRRRR